MRERNLVPRFYTTPQPLMVMVPEVRPLWSRDFDSIFLTISLPSTTSPKTTCLLLR